MDPSAFYNIVAGELRGSENTTTPRTAASLPACPVATASDVEDSVAAAQKAFPAWAGESYETRTKLLEKFADLYLSHGQEFCTLLAAETGRTAENAAVEVYWAAQWLRYPSKYKIPEERIEDDTKVTIVTHEPLGLVAAICPWNSIGKLAPAVATGNCVILKPSAGNNAAIILPDVDIKSTCDQLAGSLWFNAGQVCIAPRRLYIHQDIFEEFVQELATVSAEAAREWHSKIGPLQNKPQFEKIRILLADAEASGEKFAIGGSVACDEGAMYVHPAIIVNPSPSSRLVQEETFGPVVSCHGYSTMDEAVRLANSVETGLSATVWGKDLGLTGRIAKQLDVGNVFINGPPQPDPCVPFGGHKKSGLGVEYGMEGLLSFCQTKSIYMYK
ncbi:betaine aldehyde dehydrogenase 1 [Metarhizium guizhouense ARSEF 977]|uniref:aldehyde dehydrogenase (NAD(+)) n=1 Tax=Metarhizium guizhouense (strain ARSEF 977) TaxID=1276136 RepID=A0A0B4GVB7_METGA|nr:betaine aldehyde dehydrogenase 1 [Metarhizium guizhouense ARSEF 977]